MSMNKKPTRVLSAKKVRENAQVIKDKEEEKAKPKSNIKVAVRVRPLNKRELDISQIETVKVLDSSSLYVMDHDEISGGKGSKGSYFTFNYAFGKSSTQEELYNSAVKSMISACLEGINGSVIAYGPTGAGKTFTMLGEGNNPGIIARFLDGLFLTKDRDGGQIVIKIMFYEIYCETIKDLLDKSNNGPNSKIVIRDAPAKGTSVSGVTEKEVDDIKEVYKLLLKGNSNRTVDTTLQNDSSSRSHAIFQINLELTKSNKDTGYKESSYSKFVLADLAGSEKGQSSINKSNQKSSETGNINKSLLYLGKCIETLVEVGQSGKGFIPWRESQLTRILKDTLEGNSRSLIILNVSASVIQIEETLVSLRYGQKACNIKQNKKQHSFEEKNLTKYEEEINKGKTELENLRHMLANKIHSQHLIKEGGMNQTQYSSKIEKIVREIHAHFQEETQAIKELLSEQRKLEITKNELMLRDYELFKIEYDNDNIVNKTKGIALKQKDIQAIISKLNEKIIVHNQKIQEKYQIFSALVVKREEIENSVSKLLNDSLGSSLNVTYQFHKMQIEKYENEFKTQIKSFEVKKNEWEINKLITQIMKRDKAIESTLLELKKGGVDKVDISKERESMKKIQDFRINQSVAFAGSDNEIVQADISTEPKAPIKGDSKDPRLSIQGRKSITLPKINSPVPQIQSKLLFKDNIYDPYDRSSKPKKDYNKKNKLSVLRVAEISPNKYDYSDYHNPNIHKEKTRFNTKTSKVIEASQKGKLSELTLRLIDNIYTSSKVHIIPSANRYEDKGSISMISTNSANSPKNTSYEERNIDKKIKSISKNILKRNRRSPYVK